VSAAVVILAAVSVSCILAARSLVAASWPRRSPAAAILLWQAIGLGWGLAAVGTLMGVGATTGGGAVLTGALDQVQRVVRAGGMPAAGHLAEAIRLGCLCAGIILLTVLCWILAAATTSVVRARQRQHELLSLLAHGDPKVPGALVVDYPAAAAYCVPGLRSAIVISAGTLELLDAAELAAVLAHERAHLRERHDLVLLPFIALLRAFAWAGIARQAYHQVGLLVEMHADDRARQHRPARELATALLRVGAAGGGGVPSGALAAAGQEVDGEVAARVVRLLRPAPAISNAAFAFVIALSAAVVAIPAGLLILPLH
jgi:Zn-dependent protease with chaperone function